MKQEVNQAEFTAEIHPRKAGSSYITVPAAVVKLLRLEKGGFAKVKLEVIKRER